MIYGCFFIRGDLTWQFVCQSLFRASKREWCLETTCKPMVFFMQPALSLQWIDFDNYNNEIIAICHHTFCVSISQNNQSERSSLHTHVPDLHNTHSFPLCNYKWISRCEAFNANNMDLFFFSSFLTNRIESVSVCVGWGGVYRGSDYSQALFD